MVMATFSIWRDNEEQWIPSDAEVPEMIVKAPSAFEAAEEYAADHAYDDDCQVIVRCDKTSVYTKVKLGRAWKVSHIESVTLEELCAP